MLQIINISQVRNNLSQIVTKVMETKQPVVIIKDSFPSVVLYPYDKVLKDEEEKERLWKEEFNRLMKDSKKYFNVWLKKKGINPKDLSEEQMYELIEKA